MISTIDVARGWEHALEDLGHKVHAFEYHCRIAFFDRLYRSLQDLELMGPVPNEALVNVAVDGLCSRIVEFAPDLAVIVTGLLLPRRAYLWLQRLGVHTALILTESPYNDEQQSELCQWVDVVFTNDRSSLARLKKFNERTFYLPQSYDPHQHKPGPAIPEKAHDVYFMGTMYPERKALFDAVNWGEADALIVGTSLNKDGTIEGQPQTNEELVELYRSARICPQMHRTTADYFEGTVIGEDAYSLGPRVYEILACGGGMLLCDDSRQELYDCFTVGKDCETFSGPEELGDKARYYLAHEGERRRIVESGLKAVQPHSFVERARRVVIPALEECDA